MATGILVWSEQPALALELLGQARRLADARGAEVTLCTCGEVAPAELEAFAAHGADVVATSAECSADTARCAAALGASISQAQPGLVLIGASKLGMDVAPRVAERNGAAYAAWAVDVGYDETSGGVTASCMLYAGTGLATYRFQREMTVLTAAPGAFEADQRPGRVARLETLTPGEKSSVVEVLSMRAKASDGARLEEAKAVVDIGRGVKEADDLAQSRVLAGLLEGQLGCSRPVSSDRDWLPEWLGLSGAKIKPELCLTLGISGAIQHIVGIRDSRVVVAVNNDEDAAIFTQADIGVVADLTEFVPVLIERLKARGARPDWV
jgi:electron transfer flavoprotein alpha subunit